MNQDIMRLCAQFRLLFGRVTGMKIDLVRFTKDETYAGLILETANESQNEELEILSMQLMEHFGLLSAQQGSRKAADPMAKKIGNLW